MTKIKEGIIDALSENDCFLSKQELIEKLKSKKIKPARSTIYRELRFLIANRIIIKNTIKGIDYFEIPQNYHYHLICLKCGKISQVRINNFLKNLEKQIAKQNNFNIIYHSFNIYGYCHQCQTYLSKK